MEYSSFDDVMNQAREWINLKCKDIRIIPKEIIWEFYLAASWFIRIHTKKLAEQLGFNNLNDVVIVSFSPSGSLNLAGATCNKSGLIKVNLCSFFLYSSLDYLLIHELCHLTHHNHSHNFWNLYGECLKKLNLINSYRLFREEDLAINSYKPKFYYNELIGDGHLNENYNDIKFSVIRYSLFIPKYSYKRQLWLLPDKEDKKFISLCEKYSMNHLEGFDTYCKSNIPI